MTVKDFIDYNNPCFNCGSKIHFYINVLNHNTKVNSTISASPEKKGIRFSFKIGYLNHLYILIDTTTNSFIVNELKDFLVYTKDKDFTFNSQCTKCNCQIISNPISFSFINNFIKPISLDMENLLVKSKGSIYRVYTVFKDDTSQLSVLSKDGSFIEMNIKLFPLYKFKNKDTFMKKAKIYLLFS